MVLPTRKEARRILAPSGNPSASIHNYKGKDSMKRLFLTLSLVLASFALAAPAFAGNSGSAPTTTITKSSRHDNKVFVGINWNFGVRTGATAVVGYR
jgi:hypothetical protein